MYKASWQYQRARVDLRRFSDLQWLGDIVYLARFSDPGGVECFVGLMRFFDPHGLAGIVDLTHFSDRRRRGRAIIENLRFELDDRRALARRLAGRTGESR